MKTRTIELYQFDELSDKAKETARQWWREREGQDFGCFGELTEPAETAAKILGIEFDTHEVQLRGGKKRSEPNVYWSLHVQGSGACFEGTYSYARGCAKNIRSEFGDQALWKIADDLQALQKKHGYKLSARVSTDGRDVHKYAMSLDCVKVNGHVCATEDDDALLELMRDFADWIYNGINAEWDYRMSDENVDDAIRANEYDFRENGDRDR